MTIQAWRCLLLALKNKKSAAHGFTLIELLISMIIASLVVSGLLYLVNELIRIDRREAKLESVQRDMQRAMNYISDDLREAVYVYPDPTVVTSQLTPANLPPTVTVPGIGTASPVPVLAFWKPEPLSMQGYASLPNDCNSLPAPPAMNRANCESLKLRHSYYSLVVYFSLVNLEDNPNWPGLTRIIRYTLPQFTQVGLPTATQTAGFMPPSNDFANWMKQAGVATGGNWSVLVDYVDSGWSAYGSLIQPGNLAVTPPNPAGGCTEFGDGYRRSPVDDSTTNLSRSFLACVGVPGTVGNGLNQNVVVALRGNIRTAAEELKNPTPVWVAGSSRPSSSVLPTLKTQVLVRGAANKNPGN